MAAGISARGAEPNGAELSDLVKFDLETLLDIEVTSASKKEEKLSQTSAAIHVITQEDIRRSGFTSLPELFRMVPGMQVARVGANQWAISSRGFNDTYSNKVLVLVDGRTIYTPTFGGVLWSDQDLMLEDLERVEVIRGPGATLWGANAVNGVINIISKQAKDTQGLLLSTSAGTLERPLVNLRYGGELTPNLHYRVYSRYLNHAEFEDAAGNSLRDDWWMASGGFRLDWQPSDENLITLQGDYRRGELSGLQQTPILTAPYSELNVLDYTGLSANLLGRWTHQFSEESEFTVQAYYDRLEHGEMTTTTQENTFDLDVRHRFPIGEHNEIIWGGGYRYLPGELTSGAQIHWTEKNAHHQLANLFVQDEITMAEDRMKLTLGSKLEHNDFTGFEVQPSIRLLYSPVEQQSIWAAVSRAVRIPTRLDTTAEINLHVMPPAGMTPPVLVRVLGDSQVGSEEVISYELGYRIRPHRRLSFDAAAFFNVMDGIREFQPGNPYFATTPVPHLVVDSVASQGAEGISYGAELSAQFALTDWWRLHAGYSWIEFDFDAQTPIGAETPEQQFHLRSYLDLPRNLQLSSAAYFVDSISPWNGTSQVPIESYVRLDFGIAWKPHPSLEVGIWGHNLLDSGHPEYPSYRSPRLAEVPRSIVGRLIWSY